MKRKRCMIYRVQFYEQDRDNFINNLVTIVIQYFNSPGRKKNAWARMPKEYLINSLDVTSFIKERLNIKEQKSARIFKFK